MSVPHGPHEDILREGQKLSKPRIGDYGQIASAALSSAVLYERQSLLSERQREQQKAHSEVLSGWENYVEIASKAIQRKEQNKEQGATHLIAEAQFYDGFLRGFGLQYCDARLPSTLKGKLFSLLVSGVEYVAQGLTKAAKARINKKASASRWIVNKTLFIEDPTPFKESRYRATFQLEKSRKAALQMRNCADGIIEPVQHALDIGVASEEIAGKFLETISTRKNIHQAVINMIDAVFDPNFNAIYKDSISIIKQGVGELTNLFYLLEDFNEELNERVVEIGDKDQELLSRIDKRTQEIESYHPDNATDVDSGLQMLIALERSLKQLRQESSEDGFAQALLDLRGPLIVKLKEMDQDLIWSRGEDLRLPRALLSLISPDPKEKEASDYAPVEDAAPVVVEPDNKYVSLIAEQLCIDYAEATKLAKKVTSEQFSSRIERLHSISPSFSLASFQRISLEAVTLSLDEFNKFLERSEEALTSLRTLDPRGVLTECSPLGQNGHAYTPSTVRRTASLVRAIKDIQEPLRKLPLCNRVDFGSTWNQFLAAVNASKHLQESAVIRQLPRRLAQVSYPKNLDSELLGQSLSRLATVAGAKTLNDIRLTPGMRLELMKTTKEDARLYSIRINQQWRVVFRMENEQAQDVKIVDYH